MKYDQISRRFFLQGLGGVTLGLPLLPSLLPRAHADDNNNLRFIAVWHGNGNIPSRFFPNQLAMTNFSGGSRGVLSSKSGPVSQILGSSFNNLKKKMIVVSGLNLHGRVHNPSVMLGGHGRLDEYGHNDFSDNSFLPFPSIDQIMSKSNIIYPTPPMLRSLHLKAVREANSFVGDRPDTISYTASNTSLIQIPHQRDPRPVFNTLFGGIKSDDGKDNTQLINAKRNRSVMDQVLEDYKALLNNRRISSAEKAVLDEHVTHIDELNERINQMLASEAATCESPRTPSGPKVSPEQLSDFMSMHIDIIVAAIKCGQTKIATLMLSRVTDLDSYTFLPNGLAKRFHSETHDSSDSPYLVAVYSYFAKKVAELATKLDVVENAATGETYLDNSILYFGNCMGIGQSHSLTNLPVVLLGSGKGFLKTDQFIKYNNGVYNQLLVTIMRGMGLSPKDFRFNNQIGFGEYKRTSPSDSLLTEMLA